jgi:hypothetical protein
MTIGIGCAVIEEHHVVLNHSQPARLRIAPGTRRVLDALHRSALLRVCGGALMASLFVVPEREADGSFRADTSGVEDARELHHQRRS